MEFIKMFARMLPTVRIVQENHSESDCLCYECIDKIDVYDLAKSTVDEIEGEMQKYLMRGKLLKITHGKAKTQSHIESTNMNGTPIVEHRELRLADTSKEFGDLTPDSECDSKQNEDFYPKNDLMDMEEGENHNNEDDESEIDEQDNMTDTHVMEHQVRLIIVYFETI